MTGRPGPPNSSAGAGADLAHEPVLEQLAIQAEARRALGHEEPQPGEAVALRAAPRARGDVILQSAAILCAA
jgi:hypothetical protein